MSVAEVAAAMESPPARPSAGVSSFGLTARKTPQLATVALIHGAKKRTPATAPLCNLVRPPDGMVAVRLDNGRRVFASVGSNADAVKRHLAVRENAS
ncbi:hypothetical protein NKH33_27975 [Mesorhizobium sp. M1182]